MGHGYTFHHSPFYSLPPTPDGRYGSWKSTKYKDKLEPMEFWDYPVEQPFRIANRKGILTHPAWLIAIRTNTHADPIRRGRWVREKLLAGRVPDVPITVDAQVPEDPHKTLREPRRNSHLGAGVQLEVPPVHEPARSAVRNVRRLRALPHGGVA